MHVPPGRARRRAALLALLAPGVVCGSGAGDVDTSATSDGAAEALWEAVRSKLSMLDAFTRVRNPTYAHGHWGIASNRGKYKYGTAKTQFIFDRLRAARAAGRLPPAPVTCEAGFNAGHSALLFLDALPRARHFEFSWGAAPLQAFEPQNAAMLREVYGRERFTYIYGDTNVTLRAFAANRSSVRCDVVFVDGAKGIAHRTNDLALFRRISRPGTLVFGDEANTAECMSGQVDEAHPLCAMHNFDTEWAYNRLVRAGFLKYEACSREKKLSSPRDLVCLWTFTEQGGAT